MSGNNGNGRVKTGNYAYVDPLDKFVYGEIIKNVTQNLTSERMEFLRRGDGGSDPRRSIEAECGFPNGVISVDAYRKMYERNPIAKRVVEVMPKESWQTQPTVYEDEDADNVTEFEEAWDNLSKDLRGGSMFQDEEGSPIWEYMTRLDIGSRIGHFGVMLIGIDDGKNLQDPVDGSVTTNSHRYANWETAMTEREYNHLVGKFPEDKETLTTVWNSSQKEATTNASSVQSSSGKDPFGPSPTSQMGTDAQYFGWYGPSEYQADKPSTKQRKIMFLRVFPEYLVQVVRYESNLRNPRFGQPVMYRITLNDPRDQHSGVGLPIASIYVHWTRVLHVADVGNGFSSSEIYAPPAMRAVFNNLMGLDKLYGASPEAYWKACVNALAFNTHPQLGGDVNLNIDDIRDQVENFQNSFQRFLTGMGGEWTSLAPTATDPTPHVNCQLEAICVALGMPKRIFMGSERGELASTQDDGAWNDRLKYRQYYYITPRIIVPFIDRLILIGVLPSPDKGAAKEAVTNSIKKGRSVKNVGTGWLVYNEFPPKNPGKMPAGPSPAPMGPPAPPPVSTDPTKRRSPRPVGFISEAGYSVQWKDLESNTQMDKATIMNTRTTALAAYVAGNIETIMPLFEYYVHVCEYDEEEAQSLCDAADKNVEESLDAHSDMADKAEENDLQPTPPPGFENKPEPPPPMPGMPGGPPLPPTPPVKMGAGESLVHPETGKTVAKTPFPPKPPTKNEEDDWGELLEGELPVVINDQGEAWPIVFNQEDFVDDDGEVDTPIVVEKPVENCGGEGGTMGPCPSGDHLDALKAISDKFAKTDEMSHDQMKEQVTAILSGLDKTQLKEAAGKFGSRSAKGREERVEGIKRFMVDRRDMLKRTQVHNAFCPTGEGGGLDNSCSSSGGGLTTFKEHLDESQKGEVEKYTRSHADTFINSLKDKDKGEISQMAKEAGLRLFSSSKKGMLGEMHSALTAGHRAYEKVQA